MELIANCVSYFPFLCRNFRKSLQKLVLSVSVVVVEEQNGHRAPRRAESVWLLRDSPLEVGELCGQLRGLDYLLPSGKSQSKPAVFLISAAHRLEPAAFKIKLRMSSPRRETSR